MPDWLNVVPAEDNATLQTLALRLLLAWFFGWLVSLIARLDKPAKMDESFSLTLMLMSVLIAMATQIIGDNVARAFSLAGALSVVRFRTAASTPRDIAFVLAAVVVGMAVGAGVYSVSALGLIVLALATMAAYVGGNTVPSATTKWTDIHSLWQLTIQVGLHATNGLETELKQMTEGIQLVSAETTRRGGALELTYQYRPRSDTAANQIVASVNAISGVEYASAKKL